MHVKSIMCTMILAIICTSCARNDNGIREQLVVTGYKYIVFGSQRTNGIELYDFNKNSFIDFISSKDNKVRYLSPVVGRTGVGYCIEEKNTFEGERRTIKLMSFDLRTMKYQRIETEEINNAYPLLALSSDGQKIAYISSPNYKQADTAYLAIFDTATKRITKKVAVDKGYLEYPTKIVWLPDNISIAIWTWHPAEEVNTITEKIRPITDEFKILSKHPYPIAFCQDKYIAVLDRDEKTMPTLIIDVNSNKEHFLENSVHNVIFTYDGKYIISGIKSDLVGEFIRITTSEDFSRKYDIKLHESGTILGLSIW